VVAAAQQAGLAEIAQLAADSGRSRKAPRFTALLS